MEVDSLTFAMAVLVIGVLLAVVLLGAGLRARPVGAIFALTLGGLGAPVAWWGGIGSPAATLGLSFLLAGAAAFLALALPLAVGEGWPCVAPALAVPALLWLASRLRDPVLRGWAGLSAILAMASGFVEIQFFLDPRSGLATCPWELYV